MAIETADSATVIGADRRGVPTRMTNARDVENDAQQPPAKVAVNCPMGYSHGAPPIESPYKLKKETGDE